MKPGDVVTLRSGGPPMTVALPARPWNTWRDWAAAALAFLAAWAVLP